MAQTRWYRLDNIGKFYSYQAGDPGQTVFRIAAEINGDVDPYILQQALNEVILRYPGFNVALRSGMFWHYLEQVSTAPTVKEETTPLCFGFYEGFQRPLFRVTYFKSRINIEMSHILSDGRGTIELMKALLVAYFSKLTDEEHDSIEHMRIEPQIADPLSDQMEDSFTANYDKASAKTSKLPKPYHLRGWKNTATPSFFEYHVSASQVHAQAKQYGVSVTSFLIAAVILACSQSMPPHCVSTTISLDIPVDLRRFYQSTTLRNFFGLAFVHYDVNKSNTHSVTLEEIARSIQQQLNEATNLNTLKGRMNAMIKLEKNPILRMAPLFLKDLILEAASYLATRDVTTTVSNVGIVHLPESLSPHVRSFSMLTATKGLNFTVCTIHDDLCIGISSVFIRHDVIRNFCRIFSSLGIHGFINLNQTNDEVIESLRLGALEHPLSQLDKSKASSAHKQSSEREV